MAYFKAATLIGEPEENYENPYVYRLAGLDLNQRPTLQEAEVQSTQAPLQDIKVVIMDATTIFMGNRITTGNAIKAERAALNHRIHCVRD
jgi:hypothetical protein